MVVALAVVSAVVVSAVLTVVLVGRSSAPPRELLPSAPEYRNHQGMARWIQRRLDDEMVRPMLGETDQAEARRLLADFYGEDP